MPSSSSADSSKGTAAVRMANLALPHSRRGDLLNDHSVRHDAVALAQERDDGKIGPPVDEGRIVACRRRA
jgi:hypothetical protein